MYSVDLHPEDANASRKQAVFVLQHLPLCIYVQKPGAQWTIGSCDVPGLCPLKMSHAKWFLDKGGQFPDLGISRRQAPIIPGFGITVHSVHGAGEHTLCVDVCTSCRCSRQTCYAAHSRANSHEGVYVPRPFPRNMFQGHAPLGPEILLKRLRREDIKW